jgi:hypothetical protein
MNHQELIERSHKQAVDKGFWVNPLTKSMCLALIHSEISEALESYRKGKTNPDWNDTQAIKDSWECEIADAAIRVYDWAGGNNFEVHVLNSVHYYFKKDDEGYNFMMLHGDIDNATSGDNSMQFSLILTGLYQYAAHHGFDLLSYILWKLDYNLNREYMHGKKF